MAHQRAKGRKNASAVSQTRWPAGSGSRTPNHRVFCGVIAFGRSWVCSELLLGFERFFDEARIEVFLEGHGLLVDGVFDLEVVHGLIREVDGAQVVALLKMF